MKSNSVYFNVCKGYCGKIFLGGGKFIILILNMYMSRIFALFKFKVFTDDNFHVLQVVKFLFERVKKLWGKGENVCYKHFLTFFLKKLLSQTLKISRQL